MCYVWAVGAMERVMGLEPRPQTGRWWGWFWNTWGKKKLSGKDIDGKDFNCTPKSHQISPTRVVEPLEPRSSPPDGLGSPPNSTAKKALVGEFSNPETQNADAWDRVVCIPYSLAISAFRHQWALWKMLQAHTPRVPAAVPRAVPSGQLGTNKSAVKAVQGSPDAIALAQQPLRETKTGWKETGSPLATSNLRRV